MKARGDVPTLSGRRPWIVSEKGFKPEQGVISRPFISAFQALLRLGCGTRGDALRFASRLPLAFIFRAFGAANRMFADFEVKL